MIDKNLIEDYELEQCVLSAAMNRPDVIPELIDWGVSETTFASNQNKMIWKSIVDIHTTDTAGIESIDPITLQRVASTRLPEYTVMDATTLFTMVATTANAKHHAQQILDLETRRKLHALGRQLAERAQDLQSDAESAIADVEAGLLDHYKSDTGLLSLDTAVDDAEKWAKKNKNSEMIGLGSGFRQFDLLTYGMQPGQLFILAARPSKGKSALAWQIAHHVAEQNTVAYFSLEMDARSLVLRCLCQETGISISDLQRNNITKEQSETYSLTVADLKKRKIHVDQRGSVSLNALRARCKRLQRQHGLGLVVVDYLQLMQARNNTNSREQEVSQISRGLKALAMDLQIPVLACAQLNRTIEGRVGETSRPTLSDLRDSGQIEQDADVVGMLWWGWEHVPDIDDGDGELLIRKNRNGALGTCYVKWYPQWVKFYERAKPVG